MTDSPLQICPECGDAFIGTVHCVPKILTLTEANELRAKLVDLTTEREALGERLRMALQYGKGASETIYHHGLRIVQLRQRIARWKYVAVEYKRRLEATVVKHNNMVDQLQSERKLVADLAEEGQGLAAERDRARKISRAWKTIAAKYMRRAEVWAREYSRESERADEYFAECSQLRTKRNRARDAWKLLAKRYRFIVAHRWTESCVALKTDAITAERDALRQRVAVLEQQCVDACDVTEPSPRKPGLRVRPTSVGTL